MKTIQLDGFLFTLCEGKNYHYNTTLRKHLHQYVWEKQNGETPVDWEVHHIDFDTCNNDISNLIALPRKEHRAIHKERLHKDEDKLNEMRENLRLNARPKASEWHSSKEGREWHRKHYEQMRERLHVKVNMKCECCGVSFEGLPNHSRFCSNKCKSKWRRESGVDDVIRFCVVCDSEFKTNKFNKKKTCNRSCTNKMVWDKRKDSPNLQE